MEVLKGIAKGAVVFGIVGLLLALSAPAIATVIGVIGGEALGASAMKMAEGAFSNALYEGAFFGTFGAIHASIAPAMDWIFGKEKAKEAAPAASAEKEKSKECCKGHEHAPDMVTHDHKRKFVMVLEAKRGTQPAPTPER